MFNSCNPMDCSLSGSSVHGILQARILDWVAISFCKGSSWPRNQTQVSCIAGRFFTNWAIMQIKTTIRCHLTLVRMAIIKKSTNNKCWRGCREKGTLLHGWWECKLGQTPWRTAWRFLKIKKNRTAIWFSNSTPGHKSRENHIIQKIPAPQCS